MDIYTIDIIIGNVNFQWFDWSNASKFKVLTTYFLPPFPNLICFLRYDIMIFKLTEAECYSNAGLILGAVFGAIIGFAVIVGVVVCIVVAVSRKKKRRLREQNRAQRREPRDPRARKCDGFFVGFFLLLSYF